ncbi:hypothetical protein BVRB_7g179740 [Beta vulgaris subsp. vulgaris]|uniref:Uncharacterized protein n=1 Tax=Beta vulgaris subsp. vulgaris TaxID=3555 RepID=A0A0J8BAK4_BETVV|nr:hypothetical protein BVRB_7g179740 [Beta vulgaris subsp. vulgaris]
MKKVSTTLLIMILVLSAIFAGAVAGRDMPPDTVYRPQGLLWLLHPLLGLLPLGRPAFPFGPFGPLGGFGFFPGFKKTDKYNGMLNAEAGARAP